MFSLKRLKEAMGETTFNVFIIVIIIINEYTVSPLVYAYLMTPLMIRLVLLMLS